MLRKATAEDVAYVVENMRVADIRELRQATGLSAAEAVALLDEKPYVAFTAVRDGVPVAIFGATLEPDGTAWMFRFATSRWPEVVREVIKIGRRVMLPLFRKAGVKVLRAKTTKAADTDWLRVFGAKRSGFLTVKNPAFKVFELPLAA